MTIAGAGAEGVETPPATRRHPGLRLAYFNSKRSMNSSFPLSSSTSSVRSILKDQNFLYIHLQTVLREVSGTQTDGGGAGRREKRGHLQSRVGSG